MAFETSCFRGGTAGLSRLRTAGIALGLLAITLAAYYPALKGAMQWDDAAHVTKPALRDRKSVV